MGVVWRARDERLGRDVALKVLHRWVADDPELRERFEREASALARLEHPNVVRLYDVLEDKRQTVLVLELVEGAASTRDRGGGRSAWDEARRYCAPVAAAPRARARPRRRPSRPDARPTSSSSTARAASSSRTSASRGSHARRAARRCPACSPERPSTGRPSRPPVRRPARRPISTRSAASSSGSLSGRLPFEGEDRLATGLRRAHEAGAARSPRVAPDAPPEAVELVDRLLARDPAARGTATEAARRARRSRDDAPGRAGRRRDAVIAPRSGRDPRHPRPPRAGDRSCGVSASAQARPVHRGRVGSRSLAVVVAVIALLAAASTPSRATTRPGSTRRTSSARRSSRPRAEVARARQGRRRAGAQGQGRRRARTRSPPRSA